MPLLQKVVSVLSDAALKNTCIVLTLLIPVYNYLSVNVGDSLADFSYIFIMTAYLKRDPYNWFKKHRYLLLSILPLITGSLILYKLFAEQYLGFGILMKMFTMLRGRTFLLFLACIGVFYTFENMKPIHSKCINTIGSAMFGVYLIHENLLLRGESNGQSLLWNQLFPIAQWFERNTFVMYYFVSVIAVFIICVAIKLLHKYTIEKLYKNDKRLILIGDKLDALYGKIIWLSSDEEKAND